MKKSKVIFVMAIVMIFCMASFAIPTKAASSYLLGIRQNRENGDAYRIGTRDLFKIVTHTSNGGYIYDNTFYCIKAGPGFGGTVTDPLQTRTYNISYNLKKISEIPSTHKSALPADTNTTATIDGTTYTYSKYNALLWILDNMYLPKHSNIPERNQMRDSLLSGAFQAQLASGEMTSPGDALLNDNDIEVIQQLAIWHFTNMGEVSSGNVTGYDQGLEASGVTNITAISKKESGSSAFTQFDSMKQGDADILYTYLVKEAIKNASIYGNGATRGVPEPIEWDTTTLTTQTSGDNTIVGPFKLKKQSELGYSITSKVVDQDNHEISNYKILYEKTAGSKTELESGKTLKDIVGKNFYISVPKSLGINSVTLKLNITYYETEPMYWTVSGTNEEQPVVEVTKKPTVKELAPKGITYNFDLALRKVITAVTGKDGNAVSLVNEDGKDATREINIDKSTIPETATYKHRKDPVVVKEGDIVTYELNIYNEGGINGYASIIVDQLPTGLESVLKTGETIKSAKGNTYTAEYNTTNNKLTLTLDKTKNFVSIPAYNGTTLSNDTISLRCKVVQKPATDGETKRYLTNIAYIAEEYNEDGVKVLEDRDGNESKPTVSPTQTASNLNSTNVDSYKGDTSNQSVKNDTRNSYYYKGQQDDDDFEKVVVMPKTFDLALKKFITAINPTETEAPFADTISGREPTVTELGGGKVTYNHPAPQAVANGDIVVYTLRIYNQGETDGYAELVKDDIPEGLSFEEVVAHPVNVEYMWSLSPDGKSISTAYLSRARNATDNLLKAYDSETMEEPDYRDIKIAFKVTEPNDSKRIIENIAEIAEDADKDGNPVKDIDSTPNNDNTVPNEDDRDIEKIRLKEFDLKLVKYISAINGEKSNREITEDVSNLNKTINGKTVTTAKYEVTKVPLPVEKGDLVTYTFRIYNEGDIDGYAKEITEDIPEGLQYVASENTNPAWTVSNDGKTISTDYLSKENGENNLIKAFDGQKLSYKEVSVVLKVVTNDTSGIIRNEAEISNDQDKNGNPVVDRDSVPEEWKKENSTTEFYENNRDYPKYVEDDEDYDNIKLKQFDLALRKVITAVEDASGKTVSLVNEDGKDATRKLNIDKTTIPETATYKHRKDPVVVNEGSIVTYDINIYNEGEIDGYASIVVDQLPIGLESVLRTGDTVKSKNGNTYIVSIESIMMSSTENIISGGNHGVYTIEGERYEYDSKITLTLDKTKPVVSIPAYDAKTLSSDTISLKCKVVQKADTDGKTKRYLTNIAYIAEEYSEAGVKVEADRDGNESRPTVSPTHDSDYLNSTDMDKYKGDDSNQSVKNDTENNYYYKGQQDDDDFEKVVLMPKSFDLKLIKYISAVNGKKSNRNITVNTSNLNKVVDGKLVTTAKYDVTKVPVLVTKGDLVTYTFRIYNEGEVDGYVKQLTEDIPNGLEYVASENTNPAWTVSNDGKTITTDFLSKAKGENNLIKAYDGENLSYKEVSVILKVVSNSTSAIIRNEAEISDDEDANGNPITDRDSVPEEWKKENSTTDFYENNKDYPKYVEDDEDFDNIKLAIFDLALRKFITKIDGKEIDGVNSREPVVSIEDGNVKYTHPKDPLLVHNGSIVEYTIRIYNEGTIDGYAEEVKDDVPAGLIFLPDNDTNKKYGWKLSEDGKTITTDYLSSANESNLIKAFQNNTLVYKDVKVAFKVTEENIPSDRVLVNIAEIAKDKNDYNAPDKDSVPNNDNEMYKEDDRDYDQVKVQYFDLALLKWVNKVIVTEDGKTTERDTGHTGLENPEPIVKVDLDKKKLSKTTVKFEYTIKITNEGQIAGYAKEISDYIPEGLEFVASDNPTWTQVDGKVTTKALEKTLLQPGESATVKILLTWKNNANNLGTKINIAEISEDYNDYGSKDIDSTPNNKVNGEDDIDDAPVMLSLKTGQDRIYYVLIGTILITIIGGVMIIKKYVL
ncbi:MAG: Cys-Gln thioester bond-forming surface protein [Clostridia bacterium]|nr:Cys-Gln thioester bond-forming surface protein [Clostridia bacterium]